MHAPRRLGSDLQTHGSFWKFRPFCFELFELGYLSFDCLANNSCQMAQNVMSVMCAAIKYHKVPSGNLT